MKNDKIKGWISILVTALLLFSMFEIKYLPPIGDLLLKSIGIEPWTRGESSFHIALIYLGVPLFLSLIAVRIYAVERAKMKKRIILLSLIGLICFLNYGTSVSCEIIKKQSEGLMAIEFIGENAELSLSEPMVFDAEITLKNHGSKQLSFTIVLNDVYPKGHLNSMKILNKDGSQATFVLNPGETKTFNITNLNYSLSDAELFSGSLRTSILEVTLGYENQEVCYERGYLFALSHSFYE